MNDYFLSHFTYSNDFLRLVSQNLTDLDPWKVLSGADLIRKYSGLRTRYPNRSLVPFASRADNDDVACFDADNPEIVYLIHDYASPGWEQRKQFSSIWDWFRDAVEDMIEYEP